MMRLILLLAGLLMTSLQPVAAAGFDGLNPAVPKPGLKPAVDAAVPQLVPVKEPPQAPVSKPAPLPTSPATPVPPVVSVSSPPPSQPAPKSVAAPRGDVAIDADGGIEYDGETGRIIYRKKVLVQDPANDPKTTIACEWLTTVLPPAGGKIGEIIALTNVVITIKDSKGLQIIKGNKVVYNSTNDTIVVTGSPIVDMPSGILLGDERIIYSRATEKFEAPGKVRMIARPGSQAAVGDLLRGTNAAKTSPSPSTNHTPSKP